MQYYKIEIIVNEWVLFEKKYYLNFFDKTIFNHWANALDEQFLSSIHRFFLLQNIVNI